MPQQTPKLFLISGPSAVGKNAVINGVKKIIPQLQETISCTTRKPRPGEKDKVHYYFLSKRQFEDKIKKGEFLEHFKVHALSYGTLKSEIKRIAKKGNIPIAVIDVQGALSIDSSRSSALGRGRRNQNAVLIFIKPDSLRVLKKRLQERGTSEKEMKMRLTNAKKELKLAKKYDYQVINYDKKLNKAIKRMAEIIKKEIACNPKHWRRTRIDRNE